MRNNKFNELKAILNKKRSEKLPTLNNKPPKKKKNKKKGKKEESPKPIVKDYMFSGISRDKRSKLQDPASFSPPIGHYKPNYSLVHSSSTSNVKYVKPIVEEKAKLDKESEDEFRHLNNLLQKTIEESSPSNEVSVQK